jgi:hypothetical protein
MYFPHEANARLAAQHNKSQMQNAKDRLKRLADHRKFKKAK